jgi:ABC-type sulfate transport system permease component
MSPRYIRKDLEARDEAAAALASSMLAIGVGLITFYVVRLLLSREPLPERREREETERPGA